VQLLPLSSQAQLGASLSKSLPITLPAIPGRCKVHQRRVCKAHRLAYHYDTEVRHSSPLQGASWAQRRAGARYRATTSTIDDQHKRVPDSSEWDRHCAKASGVKPPWRQPRGKSMVSLVNSHTNATRIGWHLWEIDSRFVPGLPPGWIMNNKPPPPFRVIEAE